jgi:hypothetical protein
MATSTAEFGGVRRGFCLKGLLESAPPEVGNHFITALAC